MVKPHKTYSLLTFALGSLLCASPLPAQGQTRAPANSAGSGVQQANRELQRGTDSINKAIDRAVGKKVEKQADKAQEKIDAAKDKVGAGVEKLKSATVRKNTWIVRTYHNVTAYYNVYFNAQDSYKEGLAVAAKQYPFDYTRTLPVFTFGANEIPTLVTAEMTRAMDKSNKAIKDHSLTAKPEIKKGKRLTKKEQDFYNKREYCNSVDDAYLLIGKANMYMHEYYLAESAFDLVAVDYGTEITSYEARIWNAVLAGEQGNTQRQREMLTTLESDKKFPAKHRSLLDQAFADLLIREKKYSDAIPKVQQAVKKSWSRADNLRYHFILGQLHQQAGSSAKAVEHYTSVIRRMSPYDMEFHAKLNKAYLLTGNRGESMRKTLIKMAKDEKNKEYLDKVYFALAGIEMHAGRTEQGIAYYKLSAANSKDGPQRVLSCITLAKYFESKGDYESAQAYYDSTAMVMPKDDLEYEMVNNKAQNLGKLAANLRIIKTEDSLQRIARMSQRDRDKYVERQIAQAKAAEEKRLRDEEIRMNREAAAAEAASAFGKPTTGKWYFYNPTVVSKGLADFRRTWGNRKLADDWRRGSKSVIVDFPSPDEESKKTEEETVAPAQTAEYYLANVPLTDSLMAASNARLMEAMFDAGMVYKDYIRDNPNAIGMFEALNKRYPNHRHTLEAYFYLYVLNNEVGNANRAEQYKKRLVAEFPDELLTKYVLNPQFVSDKEVKEKEASKLYSDAYALYQSGSYQQAAALTDKGLQQYSDMNIAANFMLLNVMATGGNGNIGQYIAGLGEVVKAYPGTEPATAAQEMLSIVQKRELTLISEQLAPPPSAEPSVSYSDDDGASAFVILVPKSTNLNQLKFNFISFNADIDEDDLVVQNRAFNSDMEIITVSAFKTQAEAYSYYKKVRRYPPIFKDISIQADSYSIFSITQHNLELLEQSKIISFYLTFFQTNIDKPQ